MKFIESICLANGELRNLDWHQRRLEFTTLAHYGYSVRIDLATQLARRAFPAVGLFKLRVTYARELESIDVDPYLRRPVQRLELVEADGLDYRFKYADRHELDALRQNLAIGCQPIIAQHGCGADATYANVCLFDGQRWLTPEKPLLAGTARAAALSAGEIFPAVITAQDFRAGKYAKLKLINAMNIFSEAQEIFL